MDQTQEEEEAALLVDEEEEETPPMKEEFTYTGGHQVVPANVARVKIDKSCKRIEIEAFVGRTFLQQIDFSEARIEAILEGAFRGCAGLRFFTLPSSMITIGDKAFSGCRNLRSVKWNDQLETIGVEAFKETAIEFAPLPKNLKSLLRASFEGCWNLKEVALQAGLEKKLIGTFKRCISLERIGKHGNVELEKASIPSAVADAMDTDGNYKEVWKEVNEKNEQVYAEIAAFREVEKNLIDAKPNLQASVAGEAAPPENVEGVSSKKELDEMAIKLKKAEEKRDTLQAEKEQLEQDYESKMNALQAEKEQIAQESDSRIKALQLEMDTKLQEAKEDNLKLERENEGRLIAHKETDIKLKDATDSLQRERAEKASIMERLHLMTGDCRGVKAENERLLKEKEDKERLLLNAVGKCGALEERSKTLEERIRRLRGLRHGGHESVVSAEEEPPNDLEGLSIGLDSARGRTEKSKLSSVTGEEEENEGVAMRPSRKRKLRASTEEKSRHSAHQRTDEMMRRVERMMEDVDEIKKNLEAPEVIEMAEEAGAEGGTRIETYIHSFY